MIRLILNVVHVSHCAFIRDNKDNKISNCRLVVRIVHSVSDFASKMACTICDMAKVVATNNAAKAKTYCRSTRSLKHKNKTVLTFD